MDLNKQKELFGGAFVRAVASAAGLVITEPEADVESIDWKIRRPGGISPRVDIELKCSAAVDRSNDPIRFPIPVKDYDDLRTQPLLVPRILVAVLLPDEPEQWLELNDERMVLRHCCYWTSLAGEDPVPNEQTVTVDIPADQRFSVDAVRAMLDRVETEGRL